MKPWIICQKNTPFFLQRLKRLHCATPPEFQEIAQYPHMYRSIEDTGSSSPRDVLTYGTGMKNVKTNNPRNTKKLIMQLQTRLLSTHQKTIRSWIAAFQNVSYFIIYPKLQSRNHQKMSNFQKTQKPISKNQCQRVIQKRSAVPLQIQKYAKMTRKFFQISKKQTINKWITTFWNILCCLI